MKLTSDTTTTATQETNGRVFFCNNSRRRALGTLETKRTISSIGWTETSVCLGWTCWTNPKILCRPEALPCYTLQRRQQRTSQRVTPSTYPSLTTPDDIPQQTQQDKSPKHHNTDSIPTTQYPLTHYRPSFVFFDPLEHSHITVQSAMVVDSSEVLIVLKQSKQDGAMTRLVIEGPALHVPSEDEWCACTCRTEWLVVVDVDVLHCFQFSPISVSHSRSSTHHTSLTHCVLYFSSAQLLKRHAADEHQYLVVRYINGSKEHRKGYHSPIHIHHWSHSSHHHTLSHSLSPHTRNHLLYSPCFLHFDPSQHISITTENAISVDGSEVLVAYRQQKDEKTVRMIVKGPTVHVPTEDEW